jgi:hypothetical protein
MSSKLRAYRRRRRSKGQALIECGIFFTALIFLVLGTINIGTVLNDHVSIVYGVRQGARTAAVLGNQGGTTGTEADCAVIGAVDAALATMPNLQIWEIVIYKAGANGKPVDNTTMDTYAGNASCTVVSGVATISAGTCPTAGQISLQYACGQSGYLPAARNNQAYTEDSVGVMLVYTYTYQAPWIPFLGSFNSSDYSVFPVDPVALPSPLPTPTPACSPTC